MKIFSGSSNRPLALSIAKNLNLKLSSVEIFIFPDLEKRIRIKETVLDKDCVIIQSASIPPDENYMELFIMIDALKRSGAKSVKVLIPYLGYQRQDHVFRDGEAVSLEVIAKILKAVGADEVISFDLHSPKIPEVFPIPFTHLSALAMFSQKIKKDFDLSKIVLVSPDMGGIRRIKEVSSALGNVPFAIVNKNRDLATGEINDSNLDGDVRGKIAIIVDDMISTGKTIVEATDILLENGATKVIVFATHAVFAKDATKLLQHSKAERVFVSDTINIPAYNRFPKLQILSIAEIAAKAINKANRY
jgi:ribose-phosphate pyrophosphokinase